MRWLAALPVFNEVSSVVEILEEVKRYANDVLVVDDGSTDGTHEILADFPGITSIRHEKNVGYGGALKSAFRYAIDRGFNTIVTLDCDGQHQPKRLPRFVVAAEQADIVSGSRYLKEYEDDNAPPPERLFINRRITRDLNQRFGLSITDAFCGFKAYRTECLKQIEPKITDLGYAMPLQVWIEAALLGLKVIEIPVPRLYLDPNRTFGGSLDHAETRLQHYNKVIGECIQRACAEGRVFPELRTKICQDG